MAVEKITEAGRARYWLGDMETDYIYTLGRAGEKFFRGLKEGKIVATRCRKCNLTYLPPRIYCEHCFSELDEWVELLDEGYIEAFTVLTVDADGNKLDPPEVIAFIAFDGVTGGLIHRIGEASPDEVYPGMMVKAVWKPPEERVGSINDIKYWKPAIE
ncbi:MAG: nucleic acid-binding protein [Thermoproteota archaeon]|nr:MAG: nucleic acid-binding protein [Candidatus Korarchaeota archaeon]